MEQVSRPERIRFTDFAGRPVSLASEWSAWKNIYTGGDGTVLLGIGQGPQIHGLPDHIVRRGCHWTEAPEILEKIQASYIFPPSWTCLSREDLPARCSESTVWFHTGNLLVAHDFWSELLGYLFTSLWKLHSCQKRLSAGTGLLTDMRVIPGWQQAGTEQFSVPGEMNAREEIRKGGSGDTGDSIHAEVVHADAAGRPGAGAESARPGSADVLHGEKIVQTVRKRPVLLWGQNTQLLHQELRFACRQLGYQPVLTDIPDREDQLWALCGGEQPLFALSVNGRGLEGANRLPYLLAALHVPLVLWFVDNPWHVLSGIRLPWWKKAFLCVTDVSFCTQLKALGAEHVHCLPLACAPHMWRPLPWEAEGEDPQWAAGPPLFVGRSAFPEKERYFAATHVSQSDLVEAQALLQADVDYAALPSIEWWYARSPVPFWPGSAVRYAGAGAEALAQQNRTRWLRKAHQDIPGFQIIGDNGWKTLVPGCHLAPPVDYYRDLAQMYHEAVCVLNVTSLQLPRSLSQRHFDVWAAGGLLLSDPTPALDLFPEELVEVFRVDHPAEFGRRLQSLCGSETARAVRTEMRKILRERHSYADRIREITAWVHGVENAGF